MSPLRESPKGAMIARLALRRVAVPVERPRVFPVFEEMYRRSLREAHAGHDGPPDRARAR